MNTDITNVGNFIDAATAKANLGAYLNEHGKPQPTPEHPDHVFGHVFGLAKIKELVAKIDQHNLHEPDTNKHINGVRIYHSKTHEKKDVMIVPVTKNSHDYPDQIHGSSVKTTKTTHPLAMAAIASPMILSDGRPCPNLCG